ncbi:MAG: NADH-quinone oxidoreductase subunit G, partial [Methylococcales bacterium]|nr:NADH-quinone oxidoreductase subunit G [Methylococcales bacterium]
ANCRMCLVEVEKAPKPLPACATPINDGMKVFTKSPLAIEAQKGTMEFLLINHPLDCPICDQGGECELQDLSVGYGNDVSRYSDTKRVVAEKNIGPLIATEMTRCIHCTRCVRFGDEIAGIRELGATGRGEHTVIGTYVQKTVSSELSGNVIDLCPVGALTAKPSRYQGRAWEYKQYPLVSCHDSVGSNLYAHVRRGRMIRVVPRTNESINECWISDRDRFSYEGLYSANRLAKSLIKDGDNWSEVEWTDALSATAERLQNIIAEHGVDQLGVLISANCTLEELYLAQKLIRSLGGANIDHRTYQIDFKNQDDMPDYPWLGMSIENISDLDTVLLVGSDINKDQPMLAHKLRQIQTNGSDIMTVNQIDFDTSFDISNKIIKNNLSSALVSIIKSIEITANSISELLKNNSYDVECTEQSDLISQKLLAGKNVAILLGVIVESSIERSTICALCNEISVLTGSILGFISQDSNAAGASIAGALPHRGVDGKMLDKSGLNCDEMFNKPLKSYILIGLDSGFDLYNPVLAKNAFKSAEFVVSLTSHISDEIKNSSDIILPISSFGETSGTFINMEGQWQSYAGVVEPYEMARPTWKVLRVLANLLDLDGFEYLSTEEILNEIKNKISNKEKPKNVIKTNEISINNNKEIVRAGHKAIYSIDMLTRNATSLQKTEEITHCEVRMNKSLMKILNLENDSQVEVKQGKASSVLNLIIDNRVADDVVWIPGGTLGSQNMGGASDSVEVNKVTN